MAETNTATFRRSSHCESNGCVEVAVRTDHVSVRDGKQAAGPVLCFDPEAWAAFLAAVRTGRLNG